MAKITFRYRAVAAQAKRRSGLHLQDQFSEGTARIAAAYGEMARCSIRRVVLIEMHPRTAGCGNG